MAQCIHDFLNRIAWLFFDGGVFVVEGHTRFIVDWLATRHFFLANGSGRSLGGTTPTEGQKELALETMKAWAKLAEKTLEAEFPLTGLMHAISVFPAGVCIGSSHQIACHA